MAGVTLNIVDTPTFRIRPVIFLIINIMLSNRWGINTRFCIIIIISVLLLLHNDLQVQVSDTTMINKVIVSTQKPCLYIFLKDQVGIISNYAVDTNLFYFPHF